MFAVMKHFDLMIGIDVHTCWPPPDPKPNGPAPYLTIMFLHGLQPLTPMMAPTCLTLSGMTMQRGTDIGPGIPHIGPPSKLTPIDILLSSSVSYFGPSAYTCEGQSVAAALMMVVGLNANCWEIGPIPSGLVICPTTHFTGMTPMDVLFGVMCYGLDVAMEQATGVASEALGKQVQKRVVGPISKKLSTKLASRTASKATANAAGSAASKASSKASSKAASKTSAKASAKASSKATPNIGAHRPGSSAATPSINANRPGFKPAKPSGPRPSGGPNIGANRPSARPSGWQSAKPSQSSNPAPNNSWQPAKPTSPQRPQGGPTAGQHRPQATKPQPQMTMLEIYKDLGFDAFMEMLVSTPMSIPHQFTMELLAQSGVEEFGAPPEQQKEG